MRALHQCTILTDAGLCCRVAFALLTGAIATSCPPHTPGFQSEAYVKPMMRVLRAQKPVLQAAAVWGLNRLTWHPSALNTLSQVCQHAEELLDDIFMQKFGRCCSA
jgi:hypothetical protein